MPRALSTKSISLLTPRLTEIHPLTINSHNTIANRYKNTKRNYPKCKMNYKFYAEIHRLWIVVETYRWVWWGTRRRDWSCIRRKMIVWWYKWRTWIRCVRSTPKMRGRPIFSWINSGPKLFSWIGPKFSMISDFCWLVDLIILTNVDFLNTLS